MSQLVVSPFVLFGLISAALSTVAYFPYVRDTLVGRTQPHRASWLIWSFLGSIAFFSQLYEGATQSLWFAGAQVGGTLVVFVLSIWRGMGGLLHRADCLVLLMAALGLVAWYFTHSAVYALAITISISLLGGIVTVRKAFLQPESETMATWAASYVAAVFAIMAVGQVDWVLLAYPVYLLLLNGAIVMAVVLGRWQRTQMA